MADKDFRKEFVMKLGADVKQFFDVDLTPTGHKFWVKVSGNQEEVHFNIKNISNRPILIRSAGVRESAGYHSDFRLDPHCSTDVVKTFYWFKAAEVTLTLYVNYKEVVIEKAVEKPAEKDVSTEALVANVSAMLKKEAFSDVTLVCEGVTIPSHRFILAARSQFFNDLFAKQGQTGVVEIPDLTIATLEAMLEFVYTAKVNADETDILALFSAAHLYKIPSLLSKCSDILIERVAHDNAADIFYQAYLADYKDLKDSIAEFILESYDEVQNTDSWKRFKDLVKLDPAVNELLKCMLCH